MSQRYKLLCAVMLANLSHLNASSGDWLAFAFTITLGMLVMCDFFLSREKAGKP